LNESATKYGNWTDDKNPLTRSRLKDAAVFYYRKFDLFSTEGMSEQEKNTEIKRLKQRLEMWLKGETLGSVDAPEEGMESVVDGVEFWLQYKEEHGSHRRGLCRNDIPIFPSHGSYHGSYHAARATEGNHLAAS
jgi:hypothetical protein